MPVSQHHRRLLGDTIRAKRKAGNLTQEKLAEKAGLSAIFISRVERGKESPSMDSLVKIAGALEARVRDLVAKF
jgi:transcriptional regulator with XRE-family HTH domain